MKDPFNVASVTRPAYRFPQTDQADRVTVIFAIDFPEDDERAIAKA